MHKTHIFDQKNNANNFFLPTYLPYFFPDHYRKQTKKNSRPKQKTDQNAPSIIIESTTATFQAELLAWKG